MVPLLVEPDVPLAGQVRYARPRYDSAMVDGEDARATIDFNLREYSRIHSVLRLGAAFCAGPARGVSPFLCKFTTNQLIRATRFRFMTE